MLIIILILCLLSFLFTALLCWLVSIITPLSFSWGVAFIIWLIIIVAKGGFKMIVLMQVKETTKSGREWITQIGINDREEVIKQMNDYCEQLKYERAQLL